MIIGLVTKLRFRFISLIKLAVSIETFTKRKRYLFKRKDFIILFCENLGHKNSLQEALLNPKKTSRGLIIKCFISVCHTVSLFISVRSNLRYSRVRILCALCILYSTLGHFIKINCIVHLCPF